MAMSYPCIKYERRRMETLKADNNIYGINKSYTITVIDRLPDSPILDKILQLRMCSHDRHYVYDGLHHDVFTLYY